MRNWIKIFIKKCRKKVRVSLQKEKEECYLYYVMASEICSYIRRIHAISLKKLHVVVIEGSSLGTQLVIEKIYPTLNYLTIVTDNKESYEEIEEKIAYETGLAIGYLEEVPRDADFIIDLSEHLPDNKTFLKKGTVYLDFYQQKEKTNSILGKNPDLHYYNQIWFSYHQIYAEGHQMQKRIWREETEELLRFGDGEIPEELRGCIFVEKIGIILT
jgi:hypothetical protein